MQKLNSPLLVASTDQLGPLDEAAEKYADNYDDDDRQDIRCDVLNAWRAGAKFERNRCATALRLAREGYASEAATGLPVLPQWRERVLKMLDEALRD